MADQKSDAHTDATIEQLAALYQEHETSTGQAQRIANSATRSLSRPASLATIFSIIVLWVIGNSIARSLGVSAVEEFPFPDLAFLATLAALLIALLILTTQRHEDELAERRARLTLQIAVLSEKKIAKVIALLEEQRRENPLLPSRDDPEAEAMAAASDPRESMERLRSSEGG